VSRNNTRNTVPRRHRAARIPQINMMQRAAPFRGPLFIRVEGHCTEAA
jgi:hypothetical protein